MRAAIAHHQEGLFVETGSLLVPGQPFSIDAHPYRHSDGQWYLFYCVDFLEALGEHRVGTGIVVDRLLDMRTLAGLPRVAVRPHQDWHVFRQGRAMYGQVGDWHTVEGPPVQVHDGRVYCLSAAPGKAVPLSKKSRFGRFFLRLCLPLHCSRQIFYAD